MFKFRVAFFQRLWITPRQNPLPETNFAPVIHSFDRDTLCVA